MPSFATMVDSSYDLLDNLVAWSKNNREGLIVNYEQLSSNDLNKETIAQLSHQAEMKKIKLISIDNDVIFDADRNMILTVLRNLMANAIKFSPTESSIIIGAIAKNGRIEYSVTDQGAGMSQEQINKVLDPSIDYHSKGTMNEPGSGLGINLCQSFIQKHKGELKIESSPQKGSSFIFTLPRKSKQGND
jgi:two-component system sensor histidine kinase/response regulator